MRTSGVLVPFCVLVIGLTACGSRTSPGSGDNAQVGAASGDVPAPSGSSAPPSAPPPPASADGCPTEAPLAESPCDVPSPTHVCGPYGAGPGCGPQGDWFPRCPVLASCRNGRWSVVDATGSHR